MGIETTLAIIGFVVALVLTPVYLLLLSKGVRSLSDIRTMLTRPLRGPRSGDDSDRPSLPR